MNILLINHNTSDIDRINYLLENHTVTMIQIEDFESSNLDNIDLIMLDGDNPSELDLEDEAFNSIKSVLLSTNKPVIGFELFAQLIASTFGCNLKARESFDDITEVEIIKDLSIFDGLYEFEIYESDRLIISDLAPDLIPLAKSEHGYEIVKHASKEIWALQFLPEMFVDETLGDEMIINLIDYINRLVSTNS
jgi:anthranilate/para-aminobenzoate synthase component II